MTLIRSVSGIRGLIGKDLNTESVSHFASVFSDFLSSGVCVSGRDTRPSGRIFEEIFSSTLAFADIDTLNLGIVPTPTVLFTVKNIGASGGFIITASHNPPEYNGIKLVSSSGRFLNSKDYVRFLKYEAKPKSSSKHSSGKRITGDSLYEKHIDAVISNPLLKPDRKKYSKLKVVFDGGSGGGSIVISRLLERLGVDLIEMNTNTDGKFNRPLEPVPAHLKSLEKMVVKEGADIGLATDGDGDRIAIVTPLRGAVSEEYTVALCIDRIMRATRSSATVINQSTSMMTEILGAQSGYRVFRTSVGEANVVDGILKRKASIGGEGNGGVIFPEINLTRDALVASAILVRILSESKGSIDSVIDRMPKLYMRKYKFSVRNESVFSDFKKLFKGIPFTQTDGLRFSFKDGFVHVRKSGTEPIIRVIFEFTGEERIEETLKLMKGII